MELTYIPHPVFIQILKITLTFLLITLLNIILRSFINVPKRLDTRHGRTYLLVVRNTITLILFIVGLHISFIILGIDIAPLLASAGIIGIAVGIGARSLFEDLIAGFFLLTQSKIAIGDYITCGPNIEGTVESLGFKNMVLRAPNGAMVIVPNGQIKQITNTSFGKAVNIISIPFKAGQNVDTAISLCKDVLSILKKDANFTIYDDSKVFGVTEINGLGYYIVQVIIETPGNFRGLIDAEYRRRILNLGAKKKIKLD